MGKKNKLMKFAEMRGFNNVFEVFDMKKPEIHHLGNIIDLKGSWASKHFQNSNKICLELACGRGEYVLGLSEIYPDVNFIGVDIKGARIWKGAKTALEKKISNIAFLRTRIELINHFYSPEEVNEIWITFPDPFLGKENRRLTAPSFLDRYRKLLSKENVVHLKTDSAELYEFTLGVLDNYKGATLLYHSSDIYVNEDIVPELMIKTYYENMHLDLGKKITYIRFSLDV